MAKLYSALWWKNAFWFVLKRQNGENYALVLTIETESISFSKDVFVAILNERNLSIW